VLSDGAVKCWGSDDDGQLGRDGPPAPATAVPGITRAAGVTAGADHTCAVLEDARVMCWGSNRRGQLGRHVLERGKIIPTPAPVATISAARRVAAGGEHTCALVEDGGVKCWGRNDAGQLGDGSTTDSVVPVGVHGISGAVTLAAGRLHTCALLRDGAARCWGANTAGQLGNPRLTPSLVAVAIERLPPATAIAAGDAHSCALLGNGTVRCWGSNEVGQLGVGAAGGIVTSPVPLPGILGVVALGAGGTQTCAVLMEGTQLCWGTDGPARLDHIFFAMRTPMPLATPGVAGAAAAAPGGAHNCMLLQAGTVLCRGNNEDGQLGDGTFRSSRPPVAVTGLTAVRALASGDAHSCAVVADGGVRCWGSNISGQLGHSVAPPSSRPTTVAGASNVAGVASGDGHTCALLADGSVRCWGRNSDGQLGRGWAHRGTAHALPVVDLPKAKAIAAGADYTCAIIEDGSVRCWGKNARGVLGDRTTRHSTVPVLIAGVTDATAIAAGRTQACAVVSKGAVRCWGQAGSDLSSAEAAGLPSDGVVEVPGLRDATAVALGQNFGCAVRRHLTLVCWGSNSTGQLATPEVDAAGHPVMVTGVAYPTAVTAGSLHACAVRRDGRVRCWGRSNVGQLGAASIGEASRLPVTVDGVEQAVMISAGTAHTCAALADGRVRCWGSNEAGQLAAEPTLEFSHRPLTIDALRLK
jgi:alpha-tubulin suppressor-like RCC1 family protein